MKEQQKHTRRINTLVKITSRRERGRGRKSPPFAQPRYYMCGCPDRRGAKGLKEINGGDKMGIGMTASLVKCRIIGRFYISQIFEVDFLWVERGKGIRLDKLSQSRAPYKKCSSKKLFIQKNILQQ